MKTVPLVGQSRPPIMFSRVDFPLPLGPIRQANSPGWTVSVASTRAFTTSSPSLWSLHTCSARTTGSAGGAAAPFWAASVRLVTGHPPEDRERMGGTDAARQVGSALVSREAIRLTARARMTPAAVPAGSGAEELTPAADAAIPPMTA